MCYEDKSSPSAPSSQTEQDYEMNRCSSTDSLSTVGPLSQEMSEVSYITDLPNITVRRRQSEWIYETAAPPLYEDMFPTTSEKAPPDCELPSYEDVRYTHAL